MSLAFFSVVTVFLLSGAGYVIEVLSFIKNESCGCAPL